MINKSKIESFAMVGAGQGAPQKETHFSSEGFPFIRAGHLEELLKGKSELDLPKVNEETARQHKLKLYKPGTIVFAKSGMSATKGRIYKLRNPCYIVNHLATLELNDSVSPDFIMYALRAYSPIKLINDLSYPSISQGAIEKHKIPLPSLLSDQIRMAAVLSKAEALISQRRETLRLLDELLKCTFLEMFGDPVRNEKGWENKSLGDITSLITDGKHGDSLNEENSGYYFISAKDIHDGIIDYSNARQITKKDFEEVHRRTNLCSGDLVVVNTGATIGKLAIATMDERTSKTTFQKSVAVIKPKNDRLISIYLKFLFALRLKDLLKSSSGSAQQNLLLSQMRKIVITLPPLPLQNQFARIVKKVEALKSHFQISLKELENLYGSLSQRAFKGKL